FGKLVSPSCTRHRLLSLGHRCGRAVPGIAGIRSSYPSYNGERAESPENQTILASALGRIPTWVQRRWHPTRIEIPNTRSEDHLKKGGEPAGLGGVSPKCKRGMRVRSRAAPHG